MTASGVFVLSALVFAASLSTAFSQTTGQTRTVNVPFRSESWWSTAAHGAPEHKTATIVAPPVHVRPEQARSAASTVAGFSTPTSSSLITQVFPGPADEVPPDSDIAAGPNHIVATVNAVMAIYDKKGTLISQTGVTSFFGSLSGPGCCFDLRVLYDQNNSRFIVAAAETDNASPSSHILLAVSATSDPTGTWNKYAVDASTVFWSDFPTLGVSANALYIIADRIPFTPGTAGWDITVIQIPELLSGNSNLRITDFANVKGAGGAPVFGPIIPAITYGASDREFLVSNGAPGTLYVFSIPTSGTPTLSAAKLATTPYPPPPLAPQPKSSVGLSVGGDGIFTAVWRNGSLWVSQSIGSGPGTPAANAVVRWYEIDPVTPAVRQLGSIAGAGDAFMPALTARADGQVDVVYTTSSTTQFASSGYAHRNPTDPPGTMSVSGIYKAGDSAYPISRWGDISGIAADPDGVSTWGIAEYATNGTFGTSIIQIASGIAASPAVSLTVTPTSATIPAGQTASFTVAVAGQSLTAPVTLACTQGLPSNAACSFSPVSVPAGSPATLTISTKARSSAALRSILAFLSLSMFALVIFHRGSRRVAGVLCLLLFFGLVVSCGGVGGSGNNSGGSNGGGGNGGGGSGTPAGSYSVTVNGSSGNVNGSTTLTLVVQ